MNQPETDKHDQQHRPKDEGGEETAGVFVGVRRGSEDEEEEGVEEREDEEGDVDSDEHGGDAADEVSAAGDEPRGYDDGSLLRSVFDFTNDPGAKPSKAYGGKNACFNICDVITLLLE